jgi:hypothetical protein
MVGRRLLTHSFRDLLSQTVNADEAIVLGGIFRGAGLSKQFKVKPIVVKDIASFPIDVTYKQDLRQEDKKGRHGICCFLSWLPINLHIPLESYIVQETVRLFESTAVLPARKHLYFDKSGEFGFMIHYPTSPEMAW